MALDEMIFVSIHAPLKGATAQIDAAKSTVKGFNSRTPKGCDSLNALNRYSRLRFNSRTPKGCDANTMEMVNILAMFQFTHP